MLIHWVWFSTRPGLNDRQKKVLLDCFADPEDVYNADEAALASVEDLTEEAICALADKDLSDAQKILTQCVDLQIQICTYRDASYPSRLRHIDDPPMVLYCKGVLPDLDSAPVIGAVGTRKASAYGMNVAQRMGYQIASCGGVLVSGMAYGIDAMAMQGALLSGGSVVGVLGCGVDVVYPKSNRRLYDDVLRCGCLISEFPPKTRPYAWNFPKRNRIISGMCNGVVVIEAPEKSGALITARQAAEQGRDVFCVPGNVDLPTFEGSNALLRDGAIPVRNGWDVVEEYAAIYPGKVIFAQEKDMGEIPIANVAQPVLSPVKDNPDLAKQEKKGIDKPAAASYIDINAILPTLSDTQRCVVEHLSGEMLVDDLIDQTGMSASKVAAALTMLEIRGVVQQLPGKRVKLK